MYETSDYELMKIVVTTSDEAQFRAAMKALNSRERLTRTLNLTREQWAEMRTLAEAYATLKDKEQ